MEMDRLQPDIKYEYCDRPGEDLDGNENFGGDEKRLFQLWSNIKATVLKYRSRGFMVSAACLGLICVFSILVLQIQMKAESDVKSSQKNILQEFNETINLLQVSYSRLSTEKDQLQNDCRTDKEIKLSYMNKVEKLNKTINDMQDSYSRLTTEKDQLQNDCRSDRELKLSYVNKVDELNKTINDNQVSYSRLTSEKDQLQNRFNSIEAELKKRNSEKGYSFIDDKKTWTESRQFCRDRGGDLLVINSVEEQRYISSVFQEGVWIGLSDIDNEGVMKWVDNSALTKQFWGQGEPNDDRGKEDCVELSPKKPNEKNWNDIPCSEKRKWICEN
ncbi:L-selectin CD62 antigen-like family member L [Triplophysa tibetana]|uniref:L-selectin CD62 antigen-like family member L n=1 Tax=Triplophysa tibetana TaxID=1572043 RepID=A0A5A9PHD6_9TELE|nr:L-selectin CD62 antigen-like family member L [Triplophysa tibetana]